MKALLKTLFGDARTVAGVAAMVAVAVGLTSAGRADWAVLALPILGLAVVFWVACH